MLEKKALVKVDGKEYQVSKVFEPDLKAEEVFWKRYFTMAVKVLGDVQRKESKKVMAHEECNSLSQTKH